MHGQGFPSTHFSPHRLFCIKRYKLREFFGKPGPISKFFLCPLCHDIVSFFVLAAAAATSFTNVETREANFHCARRQTFSGERKKKRKKKRVKSPPWMSFESGSAS